MKRHTGLPAHLFFNGERRPPAAKELRDDLRKKHGKPELPPVRVAHPKVDGEHFRTDKTARLAGKEA